MITGLLVAWLLFNVAFAGWLTWARVIRPDRVKLRIEPEGNAATDEYEVQRRRVRA
jgi:hypothetical protein